MYTKCCGKCPNGTPAEFKTFEYLCHSSQWTLAVINRSVSTAVVVLSGGEDLLNGQVASVESFQKCLQFSLIFTCCKSMTSTWWTQEFPWNSSAVRGKCGRLILLMHSENAIINHQAFPRFCFKFIVIILIIHPSDWIQRLIQIDLFQSILNLSILGRVLLPPPWVALTSLAVD